MIEAVVTVQDGQREIELATLFGHTRSKSRIGVDAFDRFGNPVEIKTTTRNMVSTARDLGPRHIKKWSERYWLVSRGRNLATGFQYDRFFFLAPSHMRGWFEKITARFEKDDLLISFVLDTINRHGVCTPDQIIRIEKLLEDGKLLNDPGIPWRYIESNGIEIDVDPELPTQAAERWDELVQLHPLIETHAPAAQNWLIRDNDGIIL